MSFRGGRFGAIAKLNYDATLELELWRLLHVGAFRAAHMLEKVSDTGFCGPSGLSRSPNPADETGMSNL
jgi:hypothetical protein